MRCHGRGPGGEGERGAALTEEGAQSPRRNGDRRENYAAAETDSFTFPQPLNILISVNKIPIAHVILFLISFSLYL